MSSAAATPHVSLPPDEERARTLEAVWWTEISLALLFIALRYGTRLTVKGSLLVDDVVMGFAWLCFLADGIVIQIIGQTGGTRHFFYLTLPEQEEQTKLLVITLFIGILCTGLGKIAIGITILKIVGNTSRWQRWSVLFIMGMTIATVIVDMCVVMFRCGDPSQLWDFARLVAATANGKCIDEDKRDAFNLFSSAWQVFADFFFSVLPMAIVWQLNLPIRKKLYLIFALGLTMVTGGTGIVKTVLTSVIDGTDPTWTVFYVFIWFGTEAMLIIVFGSVPALHPLWEHWVLRRGTLRSRKGTSGSTSYGSRFKGSSSYFGGGGSSKGSRANNGHFKLDGPGKQQNVRDPFQTDDESTKNFNFTVNASSDIELGQLSGPSKQQPSTVAFAVPETNHSSGRRYDSWFQSTNTGSDEEVGLGKIHVKKEIIVSGPNGAM